MGASGPGRGWISTRPPMDAGTRARIVLGTISVLVAALASLALLNVLLEEPLPTGEDPGSGGGNNGGFNLQPPSEQGSQGQEDQGESESGGRKDPCSLIEPPVRTTALVTTVIAMGLWVISFWWRQKRQTRVMNGWAISALLVSLFAVTAMFAWWIIHKVCSLDIFDLESCLEIAHSMRNTFFFFLVGAFGLVGYGIVRLRKGMPFWSIWSIGGFIFAYLAVLALVGWIVSQDLCDRTFEEPDLPDQPPDGGNNDPPPGEEPPPEQPDQPGGQSPGGSSGGGSSPSLGSGGGPQIPSVSPFALLVVLGIAALVTILVLAVKGKQDSARAMAMAAAGLNGPGGILRLFKETDLTSNDAVVAAYNRYLDYTMLKGVQKKPTETPLEHGERAAPIIKTDYAEMIPLLTAYQHIRLADSPLPEERRGIAIRLSRMFRSASERAADKPVATKVRKVKPRRPNV